VVAVGSSGLSTASATVVVEAMSVWTLASAAGSSANGSLTRRAVTISRSRAESFGWHDVSVSRLSPTSSSTSTWLGETTKGALSTR
jgi:hypothetical protein